MTYRKLQQCSMLIWNQKTYNASASYRQIQNQYSLLHSRMVIIIIKVLSKFLNQSAM